MMFRLHLMYWIFQEMKKLKNFITEYVNIFTEQIYLASNDELEISISWVNVIKPKRLIYYISIKMQF
jgi:hypothetical protein